MPCTRTEGVGFVTVAVLASLLEPGAMLADNGALPNAEASAVTASALQDRAATVQGADTLKQQAALKQQKQSAADALDKVTALHTENTALKAKVRLLELRPAMTASAAHSGASLGLQPAPPVDGVGAGGSYTDQQRIMTEEEALR